MMTGILPHGIAAAATLAYAYAVSRTGFVTTGVQFVAPVLVVILSHLFWLWVRHGLRPGYADQVLARSAGTGVLLVVGFFALQLLTPMPSEAADLGEIATGVLGFMFCVFVLVVIVLVLVLVIRGIYRLLSAGVQAARGKDDDSLKDGASLLVVCSLLLLMSAEGLTKVLTFSAESVAVASRYVDAPPERVWEAMSQATAPEFPLPTILASFPQPVAVPVDEGVGMGANRKVEIAGREGRGILHLRVTERSDSYVKLTTLSHDSPIAAWIGIDAITYRVVGKGTGTRLAVELNFTRHLAPAWFFGPVMKGAGYFAMDVLARDTVARSL